MVADLAQSLSPEQATRILEMLDCSASPCTKIDAVCQMDPKDDGWVNDIKRFLGSYHGDHRVVSACIMFLANFPRDDVVTSIEPFVTHADLRIKYVAVCAMQQMKSNRQAQKIYKANSHVLKAL